MNPSRRNTLATLLFGAGAVGLRSLATGLPAWLLVNPRKAFADGGLPACGVRPAAQFVVFATSGSGDPINANVPGTYDASVSDPSNPIFHPQDPMGLMTPTAFSLGGTQVTAAKPWAALAAQTGVGTAASVADRLTFWHLMTNTPVHPKEPDVLRLMGATYAGEMLPSLIAKAMAPCLGTIQPQPVCVGAASPSEALTFGGNVQPIVPPVALKDTLTNPRSNAFKQLNALQSLRDRTLDDLYSLYKTGASPAQRAFVDQLVTSQSQVRAIPAQFLDDLSQIADNGAMSQITAAAILIKMGVSPVVSIHLPFGGDNHQDDGLANELAQTAGDGLPIGAANKKVYGGVELIGQLMTTLQKYGLADRTTFVSLNVFGRTLGAAKSAPGQNGRNHNPNHQASVTIGSGFKPGVVGGVAPVAGDYGATSIDSATGAASASGDVPAAATLASFAQTLLAGLGADPAFIASSITSGKIIRGALT